MKGAMNAIEQSGAEDKVVGVREFRRFGRRLSNMPRWIGLAGRTGRMRRGASSGFLGFQAFIEMTTERMGMAIMMPGPG
jgi:hypothetical protein